MDRRNYFGAKVSQEKGKSTTPCSSNYSTCSSDNQIENIKRNKPNFEISKESEILSGQIDQTMYETTFNETNFTINVLDQNLDVITDEEIFMDCIDNSHLSDPNDSTIYAPIQISKKPIDNNRPSLSSTKKQGESNKSNDISTVSSMHLEREHLITIMEETEITNRTNSFPSKKSPRNIQTNSDKLTKDNIVSKNVIKKVLFENDKRRKKSNTQVEKKKFSTWKNRNIDRNSNYRNTTESFLFWEKICENEEKLTSRYSQSFSDLNSENYEGDNEDSKIIMESTTKSFKTLDDTNLSNYPFHHTNLERRKSKSCESLLEEVKHLPHIFYEKYDRFLKHLSDEIKEIRKQNVKCTCDNHTKHLNKENGSVKSLTKISCKISGREAKNILPVSPMKLVKHNTLPDSPIKLINQNTLPVSPMKMMNQNTLSPNVLQCSSQNIHKLSPKSPNKITPKKRELYSWRKEIVSPIAEYIRGKRPSPYKNSPNKKKV